MSASGILCRGRLPVRVLEHVDEVQLVAGLDAMLAEVDDDVVALRDGLGRELALVTRAGVAVAVEIHGSVKGDRVLHDVAVVGDHVEGHPVVGDPGARRAGHLSARSPLTWCTSAIAK